MSTFNINKTQVTDYAQGTESSIDSAKYETATGEEIAITADRFEKDWGAFNTVAKLRSAIITRSILRLGNGYVVDQVTENALSHINGNGKQTFDEIIFSMDVTAAAVGDAFAEIVIDEKQIGPGNPRGIINLRELDAKNMRQIYNAKGQIIRYELLKPAAKGMFNRVRQFFTGDVVAKWDPSEILHLHSQRFAGEIKSRSIPQMMEKVIEVDQEMYNICRRTAKFQAVPFIMYKVKSDDTTTITNFKNNIRDARENGEDLIIPDDENIVSFQTVQVQPSAFLLDWKTVNDKEFYRGLNLPLIFFGGSDQTESGGKMEYAAHESIFEWDASTLETQIFRQTGFILKFNRATSLFDNLQADQAKDASAGQQGQIGFQPSDVVAGVGR